MILQAELSKRPIMVTKKTTERLEKARFYLDEAHQYYNFIIEARRKLDDKINNFIALSGVLVNVTIGLAIVLIGKTESLTTLCLLLVSVILYLAVIGIGLAFYRPTQLKVRDIRKIISEFDGEGKNSELFEPIEHMAWNLCRDGEKNEKTLSRKGGAFRIMLAIFGVAIFFLVLALASIGYNATLIPNSGNFTR
jgi:hypothetical protein